LIGDNTADLGSDCYQLTPMMGNQTGAAWNTTQIDLTCDFNWIGNFNLGVNGADGMAFVFQNTGTSVPANNGLTGTPTVPQSFTLEFDTYENNGSNTNDQGDPFPSCPAGPVSDHVSIYANGNATNPLIPAYCVADFDDGEDHDLEINWSADTKEFFAVIDGVYTISYTGDIVNNIFGSNSMVYYGFAARTGGVSSVQTFCHVSSNNTDCCSPDSGFVD